MAYEHIKKELEKQGKSQKQLSDLLGRTEAVVTNLFNGTRTLKTDEVPKIADWLSRSANFIMTGADTPKIPIRGKVGAGALVYTIESDSGEAYDYTDLPPGIEFSENLYCLRVEGDSQAPMFFDGYLVFAKSRTEGGCTDLTSKTPHIIKIKGGATMLKLIRRGYTEGKYNLRSYNADDIDDVELEWCAKIEAIVPK